MAKAYWIETLGCPKNDVDSDKLIGTLVVDGYVPAPSAEEADLVVVNTCAFIEAARQESVDTVLAHRSKTGPCLWKFLGERFKNDFFVNFKELSLQF